MQCIFLHVQVSVAYPQRVVDLQMPIAMSHWSGLNPLASDTLSKLDPHQDSLPLDILLKPFGQKGILCDIIRLLKI